MKTSSFPFRKSSHVNLLGGLLVAIGGCALSFAQGGWDPADTDGDGLSDAWETAYFGNLASTGTSDNDGDTLPNSLEFSSGRDPMLAETVAGTPDWQAVPGTLRYERWNGISGTTLSGHKIQMHRLRKTVAELRDYFP